MAETGDNAKQTILIGLGAMIVTLLMASGQWSVFDFAVALSIMAFGLYFLHRHQLGPARKAEVVLFALPFAVLTTAALIAILSTLAVLGSSIVAGIDVRISEQVARRRGEQPDLFLLHRTQTIWQLALFFLSLAGWLAWFYHHPSVGKEDEAESKPNDGVALTPPNT